MIGWGYQLELASLVGTHLTNRWSRRGYRRDEAAGGWEVMLRVIEGAGLVPPRGSAPPLGFASLQDVLS